MTTTTATGEAGQQGQRVSGYAWFVLTILCFVYILNFLDRQLLATLTKYIEGDMNLTHAQMGKLGGIYFAAFYTVIGIPVGWLADRWNRVRILALGCALWSLCTGGCGLAQTYSQLVVARMGVGVGEAGGSPPSYSIISDYFPARMRGMALGIFSFGVPLGQAFGTYFGVTIAEGLGWRTAFVSLGVIGIISAVILMLVVREPKRGAKEVKLDVHMAEAPPVSLEEEKSKFGDTIKAFVTRPSLMLAAISCGASAFVAYGLLNFTTPFLQLERHIPGKDLALWYALELATFGCLGIWISGIAVDKAAKWGRHWYGLVPAIGQVIVIVPFMLFLKAQTWQECMIWLIGPVLLNTVYLAPALAVVQNSVKPSQRTMSGALLLFVLNLIGLGLGPTFVGYMATSVYEPIFGKEHSLEHALLALTPFYVLSIVCHLLEAWALKREDDKAKAAA